MGPRGTGVTRSAPDSRAGNDRPVAEPHFYRVLACDDLQAPPLVVALGGLDEVRLGRGVSDELRRDEGGARRLHLQVADEFMSSAHARLSRVMERWTLVDAGSKNGSRISGARVSRQILADGDVVELGHTFFLYRDAVVSGVDAADGSAGLSTMVPGLARAFAELAVIAPTNVTVVIHGEVGTGKEVMARALHGLSRRTGAYVGVNCAALPATLVESELFGVRKGAFSGATEDRPGLVRSADGGTLFLDEIGELRLPAQAALLRVLQEREVVPVGGTRPVGVDLRLIAATHRDLDAMVEEGSFRADLRSRIAGYTLTLPPLRQRREDLGLLIAALVRKLPVRPRAIAPGAARRLLGHGWPGNIRELEKCLATATVLARGAALAVEHLPASIRDEPGAPAGDVPGRDALAGLLREHGGNVSAVGRQLGKAPMQIRRWMKRHGLIADAFREGPDEGEG